MKTIIDIWIRIEGIVEADTSDPNLMLKILQRDIELRFFGTMTPEVLSVRLNAPLEQGGVIRCFNEKGNLKYETE